MSRREDWRDIGVTVGIALALLALVGWPRFTREDVQLAWWFLPAAIYYAVLLPLLFVAGRLFAKRWWR